MAASVCNINILQINSVIYTCNLNKVIVNRYAHRKKMYLSRRIVQRIVSSYVLFGKTLLMLMSIIFNWNKNNDSYLLGHVLNTTMTLCTQTCCINGQ